MRPNPFFARQGNREADLTLRRFADLFPTDNRGPRPPPGGAPNPRFPPSSSNERDPLGSFLFPNTSMREGGTNYSRTYRSENGITSVSFSTITIPAGGGGADGPPPPFNAYAITLPGIWP